MTDTAFAASLLDEIAAPRGGRESYKAVLARVTDTVNRVGIRLLLIDKREPIREGRLDDIWRGAAKYVRGYELDSMRAARDEKLLGEVRNERQALLDRIAALEARLGMADEAFHQPSIAALRDMDRSARGQNIARHPVIRNGAAE